DCSQKLGLQISTVRKLFEEQKFKVLNPAPPVDLKQYFLEDTIINDIRSYTARVKSAHDTRFPWLSDVTDLYSLICFMNGGTLKEVPDYRSRSTDKLYVIAEKWGITNATDNADVMINLNRLAAIAKTHAFKDNQSRIRYDNSLQLETLHDFMELLKNTPTVFLYDAQFAEKCISRFQDMFHDREIALALYNQRAGLQRNPYEPVTPSVHVTCASCGITSQFSTRKEAERAICPTCGAKLYTSCPKCNAAVPVVSMRCACGFMISEMRFFEEYYQDTLTALKLMKPDEMQKSLALAERANPKESRLPALRQKVNDAIGDFNARLKPLDAMMQAGKYLAAKKELTKILQKYPDMNLKSRQEQIEERLKKAAERMPSASAPDAANRCFQVLEIVSDYEPAISVLRSQKPKQPLDFCAAVQNGSSGAVCTLRWRASGDVSVTYRICRKENGRPDNASDGVLKTGITQLEYQDNTIRSGISYGYAVYAERYGVYSSAAWQDVVMFSELNEKNFLVTEGKDSCDFKWTLPENACGVRILRSRGNLLPPESPDKNCTVLAEQAQTGFSDTGLTSGQNYCYRFQCIYQYNHQLQYSRGIVRSILPSPEPCKIEEIDGNVEGCTVTVSWKPLPVSQEITVCEVGSDVKKLGAKLQKVVPVSELLPFMKHIVAQADSKKDSRCSFTIPLSTSSHYMLMTTAGKKSIVCAMFPAAATEPCTIDRKQTHIESGRLLVVLNQMPARLIRIHYAVSVKHSEDEPPPYAAIEDAENGGMDCISVSDYQKNGNMFLIERIPQEELYLTVIGEIETSGGGTIFAAPSKIKLSNIPPAGIMYYIKKPLPIVEECYSLYIESYSPHIPEMYLVYRQDGYIPSTLNDVNNSIACHIPAMSDGDAEYHKNRKKLYSYQYHFSEEEWKKIPAGAVFRMMIKDAAEMRLYDVYYKNEASVKKKF
ncbi:MAG: hypothetical protein IJ644_01240, partial [Oscillospiraceae bacterium]|nr:hypothetical protein [Oscillospiraceae bacterium]